MQDGHEGLRLIGIEIIKFGNVILDVEFVERKLGLRCLKVLSRELQIKTIKQK